MKKQKAIVFLLSTVLLLTASGCQKPTKNVYKEIYEEMEVDPTQVPGYTETVSDPEDNSSVSSDDDNDYVSSDHIDSSDKKPVKTLNVKDFGAKGDGVTDDGEAIATAVKALYNYGEGSKLVFEKNRTYYVSGNTQIALSLIELKGITVEGDNTTILLDGTNGRGYLEVRNCENVTVQGFNFDLKVRAHFVGTVIGTYNKDATGDYIDIKADRDFGNYDEYIYANKEGSNKNFGMVVYENGRTSRDYLMVYSMKALDKKAGTYRYYLDFKSTMVANTEGNAKSLKLNDKVMLPTPNLSHFDENSVYIHNNSNCTLKNINIWNSQSFVVSVRYNTGPITFDHVNTVPAPDEKVNFCSWRDTYHCKANSGKLVWKNCTGSGSYDDTFNICSSIMYVSKVYKNNEVECVWQETNGSYDRTPVPGDKVVIWDTATGKLIGRTTIHRVVSAETNHYVFKDNLKGMKSGENINIAFESHCAPNSEIIDCNFEGTMRFLAGPLTIKNTVFRAAKIWITSISNIEGPLPNNIVFENCTFDPYQNFPTFLDISSSHPELVWKAGDYRLENIKFTNCKGLTKSCFQNSDNFDPNSPNYITVIPNLAN